MDGQGCISSTGYEDGSDYPSNDACTITVPADNTLAIDVIAFNTEGYYDYLFVNDAYYDGTTAPDGVVPVGNITWSADSSAEDAGWKMCLLAARLEEQLPWSNVSGSCRMDSEGCISSTGFEDGLFYPYNDACLIAVASDNTLPINVIAWATESRDNLWVNGVAYSRFSSPLGIVPTQNISWAAATSVESLGVAAGWKICLGLDAPLPWSVASGSCGIDAERCISSTGYGAPGYPNDDACTIQVPSNNSLRIAAGEFSTEANYDLLIVNGVAYSGSDGPSGIVPTGPITWSADDTGADSGWRICLEAAFAWSVASGTCLIDRDGCISSPGIEDGSDYPNDDSCQIAVASNNTLPINVIAFNTETGYDSLIVNGVSYSGSEGPVNIVPTKDISWTSDGSVADAGWKLCLGSDVGFPWKVASGTCNIDSNGCISSTLFGLDEYPRNDECTITMPSENKRAIAVMAFSTFGGDALVVNGVAYSGFDWHPWEPEYGPVGIVPTGDITWWTDDELSHDGWKICFTEDPGDKLPLWTVQSGTCFVYGECITSGNYPGRYLPEASCIFSTATFDPRNPLHIDVVDFSTELGWDEMVVNDIHYSGTRGPAGIVPRGNITWTPDSKTADRGWTLCLRPGQVAFETVSCGFESDACVWFNTGNFTWERVAGQAHDGGWWLQAVSNAPGQTFVLQGPLLRNDTDKVLFFAYKLSGSSAVALEVEHKTAETNWSSLFVKIGDTGSSWQLASIRVPRGAVGLRLLGSGEAGDEVKIDALMGTEAAWTDVACTFETDFCGWSTRKAGWDRDSDHSGMKVGAYEGSHYIFAESESILASPVFETGDSRRLLYFAYHFTGNTAYDVASLRLDAWFADSGLTTLWSYEGIGFEGSKDEWRLALVSIPEKAMALHFVMLARGGLNGVALDAVSIGVPTVNFTDLACDFELDRCLWFDAGSRSWELVTGHAYDGSRMLEATGNGSFMLQSATIFPTSETDFPFAYKLSGSSAVALEVEHKTAETNWSSLFVKTGDTGSSWQLASIRVPEGTVALRVVATLSSEGDAVKVDALLPKAWFLQSGSCEVDGDCITTGNYPDWSPQWEECYFSMARPFDPRRPLLIEAVNFTVSGITHDQLLQINSIGYAGGHSPQGVVPRGGIFKWRTSYSNFDTKWKLCLAPGEVAFEAVSCNFEFDACLWFNTGDSTWQRASGQSGQAYSDDMWMEAGNASDGPGQSFVMESSTFAATAGKVLHFAYQLHGPSASLEVEHRTSSGWSSLFLRTGETPPVWQAARMEVPDGTVALRLIANLSSETDVAKVDSVAASEAWTLLGEPKRCVVDGDCITSPNFPNPYPTHWEFADADCHFSAAPFDPRHPLVIDVNTFSTRDDVFEEHILEVNGIYYHGQTGPQGIVPRGTLWWRAESSEEAIVANSHTGWKLCLVPLQVTLEMVNCGFEHDKCLWFDTGDLTWKLQAAQEGAGADKADDGGWWLQAGNASFGQRLSLESPRFAAGRDKVLLFAYKVTGSGSSLELEHETSAGWSSLFLEMGQGSTGLSWTYALVKIPEDTFALRLLARLASEEDVVKVDSILAASSVPSAENITCSFESDLCGWSTAAVESDPGGISWRRTSGSAFQGDWYLRFDDPRASGDLTDLRDEESIVSPAFPATTDELYLEFAYLMSVTSGTDTLLALQYLQKGRWQTRWSRRTSQGSTWLQAKTTLPVGTEVLRFVASSRSSMRLDSVVVWKPVTPGTGGPVSITAGGYHNCALLLAEGRVKCWGSGANGRLGYDGTSGVGSESNSMGEALPFVDLGDNAPRVIQVSAGREHNCAVLEDGGLRCWGHNEDAQLGLGLDRTESWGDQPGEMGAFLPAVNLGARAVVQQVVTDHFHTCALLQAGKVQCWGWGQILGLELARPFFGLWTWIDEYVGDHPDDMGDKDGVLVGLDFVNLGSDFHVVQLTAGAEHTCALSSEGLVKCWGGGPAIGQGIPFADWGPEVSSYYVGDEYQEMLGLQPLDLGMKVLQISAGRYHTCVVLSDHSVKCWGENDDGQLGHGSITHQEIADANLPTTDLGEDMFAQRVEAGDYHTCAILLDESLKCWGRGTAGQLGQGSVENLGDEPGEMGDQLRPIDLDAKGVRQIAAGREHTCVVLEDDGIRCWGGNSFGQLGLGDDVNVGDNQGEMGAALKVTEVFQPKPGAGMEEVRLSDGAGEGVRRLRLLSDVPGAAAEGLLQLRHNGSFGFVCDDLFSDVTAQVACRDLGLAGGRAIFRDPASQEAKELHGEILADNLVCQGTETSLSQCSFRGWRIHDCSIREAAGVRCELDAWSEFTAVGPAGRQDHSMVWDSETQSALVFGGAAANTFRYFADLWSYHWPSRTWTELDGSGPTARSGHSAVWDPASENMLIFGGTLLGVANSEVWSYRLEHRTWQQLAVTHSPRPRAYHTAVWDPLYQTMLILGGEDGETLADLQRFSVTAGSWTARGGSSPEPRSRHTATWEPSSRSMLVFGGWDGQRYRSSLLRYHAWSDSWDEVSALGAVPLPRAGHAAAWDPITTSLLVFGGVQNVSHQDPVSASDTLTELGYDDKLYNFSLLTGAWTEFPVRADIPGPSARAYASMAFDAASTSLLLFGGFDASYLQELWRYAMSPKPAAHTDRCQLGKACVLAASPLPRLAVKRECRDSEILDFRTRDGQALLVEPGSYQTCTCEDELGPNCSQPSEFGVSVGHFLAEGPHTNQSASCYIGQACAVPEWSGVGISTGDSIILRKDCKTSRASFYSGALVTIGFNPSANALFLDMGDIEGAGAPEVVELCWCPSGSVCESPEDFSIPALELHVRCPPGQYELDGLCHLCPANSYCPDGQTQQSCPVASTSANGSSQLEECLCIKGRYRSAESASCLVCPYGSTTEAAGATSVSSCVCQEDFVNLDPANPADCECGPGFGLDVASGFCGPCPQGAYKEVGGNVPCSPCPAEQSTLQTASKSADSCFCQPGLFLENVSCSRCLPGFYCNGTGEAFPCQEGANSAPGARSPEDCLCRAGHYKNDTTSACTLCPKGRYKQSDGNEGFCPLQCPTDADSEEGSVSLSACFCKQGFSAFLDSAANLARCDNCDAFVALSCPGGFHDGTTDHRLPVAIPGYFQTGRVTAIKCNSVVDGGLSACLGSGSCSEAMSCAGNFSNACAEGSDGQLCGECPKGWARASFQAPCQPCPEVPSLPLVVSILSDVGLNVVVNFVVAAMAATAAVRGSSKLHTIMIRIATQWLAACSVIATFQLDQIQVEFPWEAATAGDAAGSATLTFAWPEEVTRALRALFDSLSLTPAWVSVDFAAQCRAQELSENPSFPRVALGLYTICLPLLAIIGVVVFCSLAVYIVVPLASRLGYSFNEVGRKMQKRGKLMVQLWEALEKVLLKAEVSVSFDELEQSGVLDVSQSELQEATKEPDAFLRRAVVSSRALMIRACADRDRAQSCSAAEDELAAEALSEAELKLAPLDEALLLKMDLSPFLQKEVAEEADLLETLLDKIIAEASGLPLLEHQAEGTENGQAQPGVEQQEEAAGEPVSPVPPEERVVDVAILKAKQSTVSIATLRSSASSKTTARTSGSSHKRATHFDVDPELDEAMDSLDFGLFTHRPGMGALVYQSVPVIWITLVALWPGLLSSFLSMIWCVPIPEDTWGPDGVVTETVSRLLPNPDVVCWSDEHFPSAVIAISGLIIWCLGIPLTLALVLLRLKNRQAIDNSRRFGYFLQGLEHQYWWWDILVKRVDVGLMMLITYTSVVQEPASKLLIFPVLSGFQMGLAAWVKPYANDQAEILDVLEVVLIATRFLFFSLVAFLLILNPSPEVTTRRPWSVCG
ncbi:rngB [Symbiodinium sp. CCMP2592]|nr:rngB [Symbiodinium sp. CCMP2592]